MGRTEAGCRVVAESLGYPFIQSGQDQGLLKRFKAANLRRADPIRFDARPGYVYRWFTAHTQHISAMGADGYERLGRQPLPAATTITPGWERDRQMLLEHFSAQDAPV